MDGASVRRSVVEVPAGAAAGTGVVVTGAGTIPLPIGKGKTAPLGAQEAPDILVGYDSGYGNADSASIGLIPGYIVESNLGGTSVRFKITIGR